MRRDVMSSPSKPAARPASFLADPRSTGAPPRPRVVDVLALRGTKKG